MADLERSAGNCPGEKQDNDSGSELTRIDEFLRRLDVQSLSARELEVIESIRQGAEHILSGSNYPEENNKTSVSELGISNGIGFFLDPEKRLILSQNGGNPEPLISLSPLENSLLSYLSSHQDQLVYREELFGVLWPDKSKTDIHKARHLSVLVWETRDKLKKASPLLAKNINIIRGSGLYWKNKHDFEKPETLPINIPAKPAVPKEKRTVKSHTRLSKSDKALAELTVLPVVSKEPETVIKTVEKVPEKEPVTVSMPVLKTVKSETIYASSEYVLLGNRGTDELKLDIVNGFVTKNGKYLTTLDSDKTKFLTALMKNGDNPISDKDLAGVLSAHGMLSPASYRTFITNLRNNLNSISDSFANRLVRTYFEGDTPGYKWNSGNREEF